MRLSASGIILAGGSSRRMGRDKASLRLGDETMLERTSRILSDVVDEVLIAGGTIAPSGAQLIPDAVENAGPVGGVLAGLRAMRHPNGVVVACDLPFLDPDVLRLLLHLAPGHDAVVPLIDTYPQPTLAVYRRTTIPVIEAKLSAGEYSLRRLLSDLHVRWVNDAELSAVVSGNQVFRNVNTPDEWQDVMRHAPVSALNRRHGP